MIEMAATVLNTDLEVTLFSDPTHTLSLSLSISHIYICIYISTMIENNVLHPDLEVTLFSDPTLRFHPNTHAYKNL